MVSLMIECGFWGTLHLDLISKGWLIIVTTCWVREHTECTTVSTYLINVLTLTRLKVQCTEKEKEAFCNTGLLVWQLLHSSHFSDLLLMAIQSVKHCSSMWLIPYQTVNHINPLPTDFDPCHIFAPLSMAKRRTCGLGGGFKWKSVLLMVGKYRTNYCRAITLHFNFMCENKHCWEQENHTLTHTTKLKLPESVSDKIWTTKKGFSLNFQRISAGPHYCN